MALKNSQKEPLSSATRQQSYRVRLKARNFKIVKVPLSETQVKQLESLHNSGYAQNKSDVLKKALEEAYEREIPKNEDI